VQDLVTVVPFEVPYESREGSTLLPTCFIKIILDTTYTHKLHILHVAAQLHLSQKCSNTAQGRQLRCM